MNQTAAAMACAAAASAMLFAAATGCGSGADPSGHPSRAPARSSPVGSTLRLAETMAGVGVKVSGPPPTPATSSACIKRWNSSTNADSRRSVLEALAAPRSALVLIGTATDYFDADQRCVVWIASRHEPSTAIVFVERAPNVFANAGAGSRLLVPPDLPVDTQGRIAA